MSDGSSGNIILWMTSPDGQTALTNAARLVHRRLKIHGIDPRRIDFLRGASHLEDEIAFIRSELTTHVLEDRRRIATHLADNPSQAARQLTRHLVQHILDQSRSSQSRDPYRYLYKRMADILRAASRFFLQKRDNQKGTAYSLTMENRPTGPLDRADYAAIPFPAKHAEKTDFSAINHKAVLTDLAYHFWTTMVASFAAGPLWIDLRHLIDWIGLHVSLRLPDDSMSEAPSVPFAFLPFDPHTVTTWATCFAASLSDKEKIALWLRYGQPSLTLKDIAHQMGLKTPSGVSAHMQNVGDKLAAFAADRPWLSQDGLQPADQNARGLFMDKLMEILKPGAITP